MSKDKLIKKELIARGIEYIFLVSFFTTIIFFLLEFYKTGIITNYISFNTVLIFTIFFGIVSVLLPCAKEKKKSVTTILLVTLLGGITSGLFTFTILPETFSWYQYIPWIIGCGVAIAIYDTIPQK